jgi:DNA-binding response OmpR family regulator
MPGKRILVVDDDAELVKALQIRLERANYEVSVASDGQEGLQKARKQKPDLIILDIVIPKMEGDSVAAALKENRATRDIPIIFLTCLAEGLTEKPDGRLRGGNFFLGKPFDTEELMTMVGDLLEVE